MGGDRYTIITADSHAGGSHAQYREYLESKYHEQFDAYRALGFHIGTAARDELRRAGGTVTGGPSSGGRRRPG